VAQWSVRASKQLVVVDGSSCSSDDDDGDAAAAAAGSFTTSLTSLRRGRGIEKRVVVIAVAGSDKIAQVQYCEMPKI
jgi:hypothetical protein